MVFSFSQHLLQQLAQFPVPLITKKDMKKAVLMGSLVAIPHYSRQRCFECNRFRDVRWFIFKDNVYCHLCGLLQKYEKRLEKAEKAEKKRIEEELKSEEENPPSD